MMNPGRHPNYWIVNTLLAATYFVLGAFCSGISSHALLVPVLFLPEGVALAAALVFGWRCAYGIFVGQLALALFNDANFDIALSIASINALEAIIAVNLARRWAIKIPIASLMDYTKLVLLVSAILQPFSAVVSNLIIWRPDSLEVGHQFVSATASWWTSNTLAQILLTPALLMVFCKPDSIKPAKLKNVFGLFLLPLMTLAVFLASQENNSVFAIVLLLAFVLLTASYGLFSLCSAAMTLAALVASILTAHGLGPFAQYEANAFFSLNFLFFGAFLPAQFMCLLVKELKIEKRQVESLSEERIQFLTYFDSLTQLPNRNIGETLLLSALGSSGSNRKDCGVILLDLDDFRHVNDAYGQTFGDAILKEVVVRIKSILEPSDHLIRLGGDEFAILLPNLKSRSSLNQIIQTVMRTVSATYFEGGKRIDLTVSCGVVTVRPNDVVTPEAVFRDAESALYSAKQAGKNVAHHYNPQLQASATSFSALADSLRNAVDRQELLIRYQPQVDISDGKIVGAEALLRWLVPTLGLLNPSAFLPIAERTGLIVRIGEWLIRSVCEQMVLWQKKGFTPIPISVNISPIQIHRSDLGKFIESTLAETKIDPALLILEITEGTFLKEDASVESFLAKIQRLGVGLSIDDFGTGYSNLAYLRRLKITSLKIDQTFVSSMHASEADRAIVKSVIDLANGLEAVPIAEGIEDKETSSLLLEMGCVKGQGYLFARPLDARDIEKYMTDHSALIDSVPKPSEDTLLVQSEDSYAERSAAMFTLLDRLPFGLMKLDPKTGRICDANRTMQHWLGYNKKELLELTCWDLMPRQSAVQELAQVNEVNQTDGGNVSYKDYVCQDGSRLSVKARTIKILGPESESGTWIVVENVAAQNAREPSMEQETLNLLFDAVCMVDESGCFVFISKVGEHIFGYSPEEMIGRPMIDFVYGPDRERTLEVARRVASGSYVAHFENRYQRKDGAVVDIMWTARWSAKDQLRIAVARDITLRKRNEEQLSLLYRLSEASNETQDLTAFFRAIRIILTEQFDSATVMVIMKDGDSDHLRVLEMDENDPEKCTDMQIPQVLCNEVLRDNKVMHLEGDALRSHAEFELLCACGDVDVWIGIPLHVNGEAIGLLTLQGFSSVKSSLDYSVTLLEYVSNQIASAVDRLGMHERLKHLSLYDQLTNLPNRSLLLDRFDAAMARVRREGTRLMLLYIDVNDFKLINDTFGHDVGDKVLQTIGRRLVQAIRATDTVSRIGGDEFICLIEGVFAEQSIQHIVENVRTKVNGNVTIDSFKIDISISVGMAIASGDNATLDALMASADKLMYAEKRARRNQLSVQQD